MLVLFSGCAYGPRQDRSRFTSARLLDNGNVLFSFQELVYRPASGIAAFPDGGIPKYEKDNNAVGIFDPRTGDCRLLMREKNSTWEHGQGLLFVMLACGKTALVSQFGQVRGKSTYSGRHWLVNVDSGKKQGLSLKEDFAALGREVGPIYLVSENGTLVFVNTLLEEPPVKGKARRDRDVPQIWVRRPDGKLVKVADGTHYECFADDSVIYWVFETRQFMAYRVSDGTTRRLDGYKTPAFQDITKGISVSSDGSRLELGRKEGDTWRYEPLPVTPVQVMRKMILLRNPLKH